MATRRNSNDSRRGSTGSPGSRFDWRIHSELLDEIESSGMERRNATQRNNATQHNISMHQINATHVVHQRIERHVDMNEIIDNLNAFNISAARVNNAVIVRHDQKLTRTESPQANGAAYPVDHNTYGYQILPTRLPSPVVQTLPKASSCQPVHREITTCPRPTVMTDTTSTNEHTETLTLVNLRSTTCNFKSDVDKLNKSPTDNIPANPASTIGTTSNHEEKKKRTLDNDSGTTSKSDIVKLGKRSVTSPRAESPPQLSRMLSPTHMEGSFSGTSTVNHQPGARADNFEEIKHTSPSLVEPPDDFETIKMPAKEQTADNGIVRKRWWRGLLR